jgi:hypothetical protein
MSEDPNRRRKLRIVGIVLVLASVILFSTVYVNATRAPAANSSSDLTDLRNKLNVVGNRTQYTQFTGGNNGNGNSGRGGGGNITMTVDQGPVSLASLAGQAGVRWTLPAGSIIRLWYFNGNDSLPGGFQGYCQMQLLDISQSPNHLIFGENFGVVGPQGDGVTPVATWGPLVSSHILEIFITNGDGSFTHTCDAYWTFSIQTS